MSKAYNYPRQGKSWAGKVCGETLHSSTPQSEKTFVFYVEAKENLFRPAQPIIHPSSLHLKWLRTLLPTDRHTAITLILEDPWFSKWAYRVRPFDRSSVNVWSTRRNGDPLNNGLSVAKISRCQMHISIIGEVKSIRACPGLFYSNYWISSRQVREYHNKGLTL